jgi:GTP-binding protein EngB required for normal cell division
VDDVVDLIKRTKETDKKISTILNLKYNIIYKLTKNEKINVTENDKKISKTLNLKYNIIYKLKPITLI